VRGGGGVFLDANLDEFWNTGFEDAAVGEPIADGAFRRSDGKRRNAQKEKTEAARKNVHRVGWRPEVRAAACRRVEEFVTTLRVGGGRWSEDSPKRRANCSPWMWQSATARAS